MKPDVWPEGDDLELIESLTALAESSGPDDDALARMRAAARTSFASSGYARPLGPVSPAGLLARLIPSGTRLRIAAAGGAVAILVLSGVGIAAAESGPGEPFYRVRLSVEAMGLPNSGSSSRLSADVTRADERLDEAVSATSGGNWDGAADAIDAYRDVVTSLTWPTTTPAPSATDARTAAMNELRAQLAKLEKLRSNSEPPETAEIDKAIAALCAQLGIPVPSPAPARSSGHRSGPTATPTPTTHGHDGGPGRSSQPSDGGSTSGSGGPHGHPWPTVDPGSGGGPWSKDGEDWSWHWDFRRGPR